MKLNTSNICVLWITFKKVFAKMKSNNRNNNYFLFLLKMVIVEINLKIFPIILEKVEEGKVDVFRPI